MKFGSEHDEIRKVVLDYLEGMIWGDEERLRRAFHPDALQVGHFGSTYEFFPLREFIDWVKNETTQPAGSPYVAELVSIEVTGTVAVAKVTDSCFESDFTDYLVLVKDRPDASGRWQIASMAEHAGLIPIGQAARLLMISEERIRQLVKQSFIPKPEKRGFVQLVGAVQGYLRYLIGR